MNSKAFNHTLFRRSVPLLLLLSGTAVLAAGRLESAPGTVKDTGVDYGVSAAAEENADAPQEQAARPVRRARTSLSMPYFSFAQALRPRS
ncbi:MAG TPA: hypothetical protein VD865_05265 [Stenotrophomonas sp.]|nr:hypothetical protein [Stenotrophomonas sp.]